MCIGVLPACFVCVRMSDPFKLELKTDMWMLGIELSPEEHPVLLSAEPSLQPQHSLRDSGVQSGSLQPHARIHPPASWGSRLHLLSQCPQCLAGQFPRLALLSVSVWQFQDYPFVLSFLLYSVPPPKDVACCKMRSGALHSTHT